MDQRSITRSLTKYFNDNRFAPDKRLARELLFALADAFKNSDLGRGDNPSNFLQEFKEQSKRLC